MPASVPLLGPAGAIATLDQPLGLNGRQVASQAAAAAALGGPLTLPDLASVKPADAGAFWVASASDGAGTTRTGAAVTFPTQGLIVRYTRPPVPDPLANYQGFVSQSPGAQVVYLKGGVPALAQARQPSDQSSWGSIEFVVGGANVVVMGHDDQATLVDVAQSILDRTNSGG